MVFKLLLPLLTTIGETTITKEIHYLDITDEICPITFVKTKLLIEKVSPGEIIEVRLCGGEPLENVPRSVTHEGHTVLSLTAEPDTEDTYLLVIQKKNLVS